MLFSSIERRKTQKEAATMVLADGDAQLPDLPTTISTYSQKEKEIFHMDTNRIYESNTTNGSTERLGENGLRLQDYDSGEQLDGKEVIFSQEDLVEFATGKIANVFGSEYFNGFV